MKIVITCVIVTALLLLVTGCGNTFSTDEVRGTLQLRVNNTIGSKTLLPALDIVPASYRITGSGPEGTSFDVTTNNEDTAINYLRFGEWQVFVEARNAGGYPIGGGNSTAVIHTGGVTPLSVTIRLFEGAGTFDLNVTWAENEVESPVITGILRSHDGSDITLSFQNETASAGTAARRVNTGNTIPSGYYTLIVQVNDLGDGSGAGHLALGAVETARILKDQTTYGTYHLHGVPGLGKLSVNVIQDFDDPLDVYIENNATLPGTLAFDGGGTFTARAAIPADDEDRDSVTYVWYLNGSSLGTGNSFTVDMNNSPFATNIDEKYAPGHYRLDVTAFNTDGSRGGSATYEFDVTGNPAALVIPDILYTNNAKGSYDIYAVSADGSGIKRLTTDPSNESWAKMNASKTKILFTSDKDGDNEIYVMDINGLNSIQLTSNSFEDIEPLWSPDGSKIAFRSNRDGNWELYVIDADGTNELRLTTNANIDFLHKWSPDSSKLVYNTIISDNTHWDINTVTVNNATRLNLTPGTTRDMAPGFSPDGSKILFHSERAGQSDIYVMNADGSNITRLTHAPNTQMDNAFWSPDGSKIVFRLVEGSNPARFLIEMMDADGSNSRTLTNNNYHSQFQAWSPDGKNMLIKTNRDGIWELYNLQLDGNIQTRLTHSSEPDTGLDWQ